METTFASFEPLPEDKASKEEEYRHEAKIRWAAIQEIVRDKDLVELKSDYYGMSTFWLNPQTQRITEVASLGDSKPVFFTPTADVYRHIAALNNLSVPAETVWNTNIY